MLYVRLVLLWHFPMSALVATNALYCAVVLELADNFLYATFRKTSFFLQFADGNRWVATNDRKNFLVTFFYSYIPVFNMVISFSVRKRHLPRGRLSLVRPAKYTRSRRFTS